MSQTRIICPHCGMEPKWLEHFSLVPEHSFAGRRCEGSHQVPRNSESDRRPLWKDDNGEADESRGREKAILRGDANA